MPPASQILMETAGRMMDGETVAERVTAAHMLEQLGDRRALPWLKEGAPWNHPTNPQPRNPHKPRS